MTSGADLELVIREGKRFRTAHLDVRAMASPLAYPRVGLVVPKFDQTAVRRNRVKRRLRELVRLRLLHSLPRLDVVLRARRETYGASFAVLAGEMSELRNVLDRAFPPGD